jgi:hypothetical protein
MTAVFNFQDDPNGNPRPTQAFAITALVEDATNGVDYAIVRLANTPGNTIGIGRAARSDIRLSSTVAIIGHPAGVPKRIEAGPVTTLNTTQIGYNDIDTLGGNSGSGILDAQTGLLVGVHTNGGCRTAGDGFNFGVPISRLRENSPIVRSLSSSQFVLHTGTILHETPAGFAFLVASNGDVIAVKKQGTGTGSTEVHVLSASSGYQNFSLHTGTALHETGNDFEFQVAPNGDLFAIKKRGTGSGSTEVHVLSRASNYASFVLQTGTALHETDSTFRFLLDAQRNLWAIKLSGTDSNSTEVHILSAAVQYGSFSRHIGTVLHETPRDFDFGLLDGRRLVAIKRAGTGSGSTEVHIVQLD